MAQLYQQVLRRLAELERQVGNNIQFAKVSQVKPDFIKCYLGKNKATGKDVESGWMSIVSDNHGVSRESRGYKPGQNVMLIRPRGDQDTDTVVLPAGPNKDHLRPDHASKDGKDEETYQQKSNRQRNTAETWEMFIQDEEQKQQQQQTTKTSPNGSTASASDPHWQDLLDQANQREGDAKNSPKMKLRVNKSGGITGRIGKTVRFAAHDKGAKFRVGGNFVVVQEDKVTIKSAAGDLYLHGSGQIYVNKPPELKSAGEDPIPQDDA